MGATFSTHGRNEFTWETWAEKAGNFSIYLREMRCKTVSWIELSDKDSPMMGFYEHNDEP
jgi:hypothetical protein